MNRALRVKINTFLVAIAASYLTLGATDGHTAASIWWLYAIVSGLLAATNLILLHHEHTH